MVDEIKTQEKKVEEVIKVEEREEKKIVEQEVKKVSEGKESVEEGEKKIAEKIEKAEEKVLKEEEKLEKVEKKEVKEKAEIKGDKKKDASVKGMSLPISTKQAIAICNFIKGKDVDKAIGDLEEVGKLRKPVPMRGEIPHKKGIMSGRYPVNASKVFIRLLKSLKSNAIVRELELEKYKLAGMTNLATRPYRRGGRTRFKRSHVEIKLVERKKVRK